MARKKSQKALQRELIDDYITSYQNQMQKQAEEEMAKNYAPAITNSGMSKEDIDGIINSYKPQTQEIPKLEEQNTTPSTNPSTPSISEELERMRKAKADTTTPRTEGEQKAIDTYYNSLLEASGKSAPKAPQIDTPTTDYRAELERARAMKADTSTARTEGENKAIDTYITSLEEAQRYLDSQKPKKNIGTVQVKADGTKTYTKNMSDKEQKEYKSKLIQNAKEVGKWAKENATPRERALSPNEQRDLERAVNAVKGAQAKEVGKWAKENAVDRGRALSPNEQRDLERAQEAQKKAEENKAKVVKETMDMATSYAEKAPDNSLTVNTITKDATPTPTPTAGAQDLFKGYAQTMVDNGKQQELEQFVDEANDTLRKQQENILNPKIDDSKWLVKKDELDTLMQNPEFAKDMETLRKATFENADQDATVMPEYVEAYFAPKAEGGMYSKSEYYKLLEDKYNLTPAQLNDVADTLQYYEREKEREQAAQDFQKIGQAHPLIGRLGSYAGTAGSGIEGMWNAGLATLTGDPRTQSHLFDTAKNELRTGVANSFNSDLMKNAYQIIAGLGDLGVGVAMGNAPLVLAGNTAGEATTNAIERGVDVNKAGLYGSLAGVTDYYFNKVGLDKAKDLAMDKLTKEGAKQFLKRTGVAAGIEGAENLLQDGVQMAFDELISGKNSENQISYAQKIASGETPEQAFLDVVKERALQFAGSFVTGALMGAGMQAGTTALNVIPTLDPIHGRTPKGEIDTETLARINEDMQNTVAQKINDIPRMEVGDTVAPDARIPVMEEPENPFAGQKQEYKNPWSDTADNLVSKDSYARSEEYRAMSTKFSENWNKSKALREENRELNKLLKAESSPKPKTEWTDADRIQSLLGYKPENYTPKGQEILNKISENDKIIKALDAESSTLEESMNYMEAQARLKQLSDYQSSGITPATQTDYVGFNANKASHGYSDYVKDGKAIIAEMSPEEYIQRCAYEIFNREGHSTLETTLNGRAQQDIDALAEKIQQGIKLDAPYLDYTDGGQEGLHRALAAYKLGIDKIPVIVKGTPQDVNNLGDTARRFIADTDLERRSRALDKEIEELGGIEELYDDEDLAEIPYMEEPSNGGNTTPPSEPPLETRNIDSDDTNLSRVYTNTLAKNKVIDMANRTSVINAQYNVHHMNDVLDEARRRYTDDAERWEKAYSNDSMSIQNDADIATVMFLLEDKRARIEALQKNGGDKNEIAKLVTERDILARRLRAAGTRLGEGVKAFDYFNGTADGAIINAQRMYDKQAKKWANKNPKKAKKLTQVADKLGEKIEKQKTSSLLSKALEQLGNDTKYTDEAVRQPKSFEQIRKEVEATLQREFASIDDQFTQEDIDFIAHMIEDKSEIGKTAKRYGMTIADVLTDEIQHRLEHGEWYDYAGDEVPEKRFNSTLKSALNQTLETEPTKVEADLAKDSRKMIRRQVVDTLTSEFGSIEDMFDDADIDYLTNLIDSGATSKELADMLKTKMSTGIWDIPQETRDKVNNLFEQAQQFGENSKERVDLETEAFWELANCTNQKASLGDKFEAWRYLAMLGNPKTHVRNIIGNKMFGAVTGVSNTIAAKMEEAYDKKHFKKTGEHIERTKAVLNKSDKGLVNRCGKDAFDNAYRALSGDKWHDSRGVQNAIKSQRDVFNSKALNKYNRLNNAALSGEDTLAMKNKYKTSLAGYLKANGFDESIFDDEVRYKEMISEMRRTKRPTNEQKALRDELSRKVEALEKGREYAVKQAEYAAFHEENKVADILSDLSRKLNTSDSWAARMIGKGFEGLLPFKKTPANILRSGFEYSPLNIIQDAVRAVKLKKGTGTAADLFESMGKTLTGDMLAVIGAFMYSQGMLNMEDDDTKWQGDLEGKQNYSVTIPIGKNKYTFTIDFLAPSAMPVFLGAQAMKLWDSNRRNPPGSFWDYFSQALKTTNELLSPIAETSMLQGINDTLESVAEGEGVDALGNLGTSVLTGYASQGIPTLVGQVARTIDPIRRSTYSSENEKIGRTFDKRMEKIQNKIPFLSMLNEPYLDAYGREQTNSPFNTGLAPIDYLGNFAYQSFIPSYVRKEEQTPADKSAWDIYNGVDADGEKIKDPAVFASIAPLSINGQRLSDEQNYLYTKTNGEANLAIRNALANSDWFNALSAPERLEIVKKVDTLTKNLGQYEVDPNSINVKGDLETFLNASQGYDANGFKTKDLQAGVDSFLNSYEAQYNPYGLGNERYQEAKENEEDLTKFEGFKEALADAGLDYSKDAEDAFFGKTVDGSYFGKGAEAVKKYADYKNVLKENDMRSSKAVADAFTSGGVEGVNEYADRKQTAIDAGYVKKDGTANLDAYNKAFEVMGSAEGAKAYKDISTEIEDMGYTKQADYIPYLTEVAASDEEMGQILYLMNKPDEGSEADQAYNDFGYEGLAMYRQLQYMTPDYPSKNHPKGDGKINTYDRIQQLYEWGYKDNSDEFNFFINSGFKYKK